MGVHAIDLKKGETVAGVARISARELEQAGVQEEAESGDAKQGQAAASWEGGDKGGKAKGKRKPAAKKKAAAKKNKPAKKPRSSKKS
jgi:hypothetical protein